jgi:adenylosuccinate lyase
MGRVWSEERRFRRWLEVEIAATEKLAKRGVVPAEIAEKEFARRRRGRAAR